MEVAEMSKRVRYFVTDERKIYEVFDLLPLSHDKIEWYLSKRIEEAHQPNHDNGNNSKE